MGALFFVGDAPPHNTQKNTHRTARVVAQEEAAMHRHFDDLRTLARSFQGFKISTGAVLRLLSQLQIRFCYFVLCSKPGLRQDRIAKNIRKLRSHYRFKIEGADPQVFVGLACKVFLPLDDDWYKGSNTGYNEATKKHSEKYDDGEAEDLTLADERIKFSTSSEEMKCLNLKFGISNLDKKGYDELLALAVSFHHYQGIITVLVLTAVWENWSGETMLPLYQPIHPLPPNRKAGVAVLVPWKKCKLNC